MQGILEALELIQDNNHSKGKNLSKFKLQTCKGSNCDRQWHWGFHTAASDRQNLVKHKSSMDSKKPSNGCVARKTKLHFSHFVCPSCNASPEQWFHHLIPHLCAKIEALDPSNNRNRCHEILQQLYSKRTFCPDFLSAGTFLFLI